MLTVALLDAKASLNEYTIQQVINYIPNYPLKINFQISDDQTLIRLMAMYTPNVSKMNVIFQQRDGTTLTKAAAPLFNPQDMSIWQILLLAADTMNITGSNFQVILDLNGDSTQPDLSDATCLLSGMAYNALAKVTFDGEC